MPARISFAQNPHLEFKKVLHQRVNNYFSETGLSRNYNRTMVFKTFVMLSLYILPFVLIMTVSLPFWALLIAYFVMGTAIAGIGMSVMHDANHAGYSSNQKVNCWLGLTMNLLGGDAYNWKIKHNKLHHVFTNIYGKDEDIDSRAILRFAYASPLKKYHRFQYIYVWALYTLMTLSIVVTDIPKRFKYRRKGETNISPSRFRTSLAWLITGKLIYFSVFFVLPVWLAGLLWWQVIVGFLIMHLTAGTIMSLVFQMAHVVEGPQQVLPDKDGRIPDTLIEHQMKTTADFAKNNKILSWYVGGLNFQVEHHLYPKVCHVHYPAIAKIVEQTTREYDIPYYVYDKFSEAFMAHFRTLKKLGRVKI